MLSLFSWCSSLFPRTFRFFMSIRTLCQKIGTLRNCLPCAVKNRIDSRPPMEVSLSSMFSRKTRTIRTIRKFSNLVQIRRNMISVSQSDDDSIDCRFGDGKCAIQFNKECIGLASRQDKSYLLSLPENKNASSYENVTKKRK